MINESFEYKSVSMRLPISYYKFVKEHRINLSALMRCAIRSLSPKPFSKRYEDEANKHLIKILKGMPHHLFVRKHNPYRLEVYSIDENEKNNTSQEDNKDDLGDMTLGHTI